MEITISTHNGSKVAREHNRRNPKVVSKEDHIDPNGHFEVWLDLDPREEYARIFGQAVEEYNAKQTREERKIADYYDQISKDEQKHLVYEMIIGIYGKNDDGTPVCPKEEGKKILRAFVEDWSHRNPHLELVGAYYHADEQGQPHCHIDYICVADGYARGLSKRNSVSKALQQQGFKPQGKLTEQMQWQARENQFLGNLCASRGFTVLHPGSKEHLETEIFKARKQVEEAEQELAKVTQTIAERQNELEAVTDELETMKARKSLSQAVLDVMAEPYPSIEVERVPEHRNPITRKVTPPKVILLEEDYEGLRQRAQVSEWLKKAMADLKYMGESLTRKLNHRQRVAELQERAEQAEAETRSAQLALTYARGEIATIKQEMADQQEFMQRCRDHSGRSVWEVFLDVMTRYREHTRYNGRNGE